MKINIRPNAIEISVPGSLIFVGIIMVATSSGVIMITFHIELWWDVINTISVSSLWIFIVYLNLLIGILFLAAGIYTFITHDKKLD